jgi:hypothetical protein
LLAVKLGIANVDEMLHGITQKQWIEWQIIMSTHPFLFDGGNSTNALNCVTIANSQGGKLSLKDFLLNAKPTKTNDKNIERILQGL